MFIFICWFIKPIKYHVYFRCNFEFCLVNFSIKFLRSTSTRCQTISFIWVISSQSSCHKWIKKKQHERLQIISYLVGVGFLVVRKDDKRYTPRNAKQTHRNHDIIPSILFVHRIALKERQWTKQKKNIYNQQQQKQPITSSQHKETKTALRKSTRVKMKQKNKTRNQIEKIRIKYSMNSSSGAVG